VKEIIVWTITEFTCGDRGGLGKQLLLNALRYIIATFDKQAPFRLELLAVPTSTEGNNNQNRLEQYYESIGFIKDSSQQISGKMYGITDDDIIKILEEKEAEKFYTISH
jgi:hypothetical protein